MNSSDVRIVRLIPTTTDGSFSRASDATFYDAAGVLQTAPPNTLRVTYDPSDLSKAPYAVIEPAATNLQPYSSNLANPSGWNRANADVVDNVTIGPDGAVTADSWTVAANGASTIAGLIVSVPVGATISVSRFIKKAVGTDWIFLGVQGPSFLNEAGVFLNIVTGEVGASQVLAGTQVAYRSGSAKAESIGNGWFRVSASFDTTVTTSVVNILRAARSDGAIGSPLAGDAYFLWGAQTEVGLATTSYFPTTNAAGMRAADAVGAGAGLLYSNVAITEPLWVAGTYAKGAKVRDAQNFVFESLVDGNTAPLTDTTKTKWLPLGITNRWKVFDKAVNSQTSAPGRLTFAVKPGAVATTMMLLNMEGASVTVGQTESGYVRTKSLVSHEVDNWYDFYYEEPVRAGDAVFTDIPPFPNAMLTVSIDNGPLEAKIGACLIGKPMVIGKATASFKAGVLSYSTSTADTFGNITMVKRYNAPRMNFDVMIPAGSESVVYRILREYTDTEIGIIVGDSLSMGIGYGYLGQWDVPKSGSGRTAPIEFKGLV